MAALMKLVPVSQITYGTDYPYFALDQINDLRQLGLTPQQLQDIGGGNAMRLIPSLKS
jgi:predicted TIM-barrel fold metal-dependent hydrolase